MSWLVPILATPALAAGVYLVIISTRSPLLAACIIATAIVVGLMLPISKLSESGE